MGGGWQQEQFEHYKINFDDSKDGLSVWELIELIGTGQFSKGMDRQTVSMAINEVFNELILDVLKQVSPVTLHCFSPSAFHMFEIKHLHHRDECKSLTLLHRFRAGIKFLIFSGFHFKELLVHF